MFDTNVIGYNICSREAIKIMNEIKIKEGHIININRYNYLNLIKLYECFSGMDRLVSRWNIWIFHVSS